MDYRQEILAYETLQVLPELNDKGLRELFEEGGRPTEVLAGLDTLFADYDDLKVSIKELIGPFLRSFAVSVVGEEDYPVELLDAAFPPFLFYYKGDITLLEKSGLSVVGTRKASEKGLRRAKRLARELAAGGETVVSGLARGIDSAALKAAISAGGSVIAVIGTPINQYYPPENRELQEEIAANHLLISPVPFYRYSRDSFDKRRRYFPLRNAVMSAISRGTVIVEAGQRSGTLSQANAALKQSRALYILNSCFENGEISWPAYYETKGAVRVKSLADIA